MWEPPSDPDTLDWDETEPDSVRAYFRAKIAWVEAHPDHPHARALNYMKHALTLPDAELMKLGEGPAPV